MKSVFPRDFSAMPTVSAIMGMLLLRVVPSHSDPRQGVSETTWVNVDASGGELDNWKDIWLSRSVLDCLWTCSSRYGRGGCTCAEFDTTSNVCSRVDVHSVVSAETNQSRRRQRFCLKSSRRCAESPGFELFEMGGQVPVCLHLPQPGLQLTKDYYGAKEECRKKNSVLCTPETVEKIRLIRENVATSYKDKYFWAGLEDMYRNGTFIWADNGMPIQPDSYSLWYNHPSWYSDQGFFCGTIHLGTQQLFGTLCAHKLHYACEKNL